MYMNALGTAFFCTVCALVGMVTFAYYAFIQCDPYADHQISNANQVSQLVFTVPRKSPIISTFQ